MLLLAATAVLALGSCGGGDGSSTAEPTARAAVHTRPVAAKPSRPNVVLLIFDEFPSDSLLGRDGRIDAVRYPNFAALAGDGTWFRNAFSIYDSTTKAVPLILDAIRPHIGTSADTRYHPHSIFDMFGRRHYRIVASEEATAICPRRWCPGARTRRPAILPSLNRGRPERFARWVRGIQPSRRRGFWMKHVLLPHMPYIFLPSGARAREKVRDLVPGMNSVPGFHDEFLTRHNEQRYLLQLQYTDRLLGTLIAHLKRTGMYDRTLIAITADHGIAFQVGVQTRRSVSDSNVEELTPVPMIVKAPGQRRGRASSTLVSTVDLTPTIADVLGYRLGYPHDGRSAFSRAVRRRNTVRLNTRDFAHVVSISRRAWQSRRRAVVRRRLRQFGSGAQGLFTGIGPNRALIGRVPTELRRAGASRLRARVADAGELRAVRRASGVVPAQIAGDLSGGSGGQKRDIAVAVNGRIEAVGRSFYLAGQSTEHFAVNVPETTLHEGDNDIEVFEVLGGRRLRLLAHV
jgi:Sulfatase